MKTVNKTIKTIAIILIIAFLVNFASLALLSHLSEEQMTKLIYNMAACLAALGGISYAMWYFNQK